MVISPGPEAMTRHAKLTTIESACENRFYTQDLKNVDRKGIAIVLGHNASNHFCPTVIISQREYVSWQLEYVGLMASSTLTLISEVDRNNCNQSQKAILEKLDTTLAQAVRSFGGSTKSISSATGHAKDVMFSQVQPRVHMSLAALLSLILLLQALKKRGEKSIIVQSVLIIL